MNGDRPLGGDKLQRAVAFDADLHRGEGGQVFGERVGEQQPSFLDQGHRSDADDRLGHRVDAEDRVGRHRRPAGPEAPNRSAIGDAAVAGDERRDAGGAAGGDFARIASLRRGRAGRDRPTSSGSAVGRPNWVFGGVGKRRSRRVDRSAEHGLSARPGQRIAADLPEWFEWAAYSARQLMGQTVPNSPDELDYLQREPVRVVAIITPWNYPLLMIVEKLAPALVVGNTCVIKPPSIDALTALKLAEIMDTI